MRRYQWLAPWLVAASASAQELAEDPPPPPPLWEELLRLDARLDALEADPERQDGDAHAPIDLSGAELASIPAPAHDHVLARAWYEKLTIRGYAALTYLDTGGVGTTEDGSFLVREASLFLDADVWERTTLFTEIWVTRYLYGDPFSLGELYLRFSGLLAAGEGPGLGVKVGRFEIPFGEDYLRWDATETPFIAFSAPDPYGIDEGVELYGALGPLRWIAAVTNGAGGSGSDDGPAKQVAAKLHGEPCGDLYLSASALSTGSTEKTALRLSGSALEPVGTDAPSTAGTSPSDEVSSVCWELDAWIARERRASLRLQLGRAHVNDESNAFDRELTWIQAEPALRLREDLELVLRYSAIGTYDDDEGYRFEGKPIADGETLGYDTSVLKRLAAALRWRANPYLAAKVEVGHDWVDLIDVSPFDEENDERLYFGVELVGAF